MVSKRLPGGVWRDSAQSAGVIFASREVPPRQPVSHCQHDLRAPPPPPRRHGSICHFSPYLKHLNWRLTHKPNWYKKSLHSDKRSETAKAVFASLPCLFALFSNSVIFFTAEVNEAKEGVLKGLSACKGK